MLIGYARVSTTDQNSDLQIDALLKADVDRRHIFEDRMSGIRADRPKLNEVLEYLAEGDVLVVWKLDRLARSLPHLIEIVAGLDRRGIGFRSLTESIDTTTAGGRLTFHIFGALAQFERDIIRERTVAGLEAAAARGRKGGRPKAMSEAKIEAARRLLAGGMPIKDVATTLEVGISTLYRYGLAGTAVAPQAAREMPDL
ncbi:recombinase family protein [Skermanella pratensis]|uniref:recombinase family protein n=1 Tax=Skermanella pratensis TaxID=2233999 RepID=UPI0017882CEA|nr:recombinase family protein [Skermanella pratensis]